MTDDLKDRRYADKFGNHNQPFEMTLKQALAWMAGILAVLVPSAFAYGSYNTTSNEAALMPAMQIEIHAIQQEVTSTRGDVQMLKERRLEDASSVRDIRNEIMTKLEIIDGKLDNKVDKIGYGKSR